MSDHIKHFETTNELKLLSDAIEIFGVEQTFDPWTSCKNCQPVEEGRYIVCVFVPEIKKHYVYIATWIMDNWWRSNGEKSCKITDVVTHFMPLPDLPEECESDC